MFESELKYCPQCHDEYRADIEKCHVCACALVTGRELMVGVAAQQAIMAGRRGELCADDELVVVRRGPLAEMKVYEELLNRQRISTVLAGDESSCGKGCCAANFELVVRREEAHDAVQIIEAEIRRTAIIEGMVPGRSESVFDPLAPDNTCPACGHLFSGGMECPDCGLCF